MLLLGAKSTTNPLASIPAELSTLKTLFESRQTDTPPFNLQYEPYFTQNQLKTTLGQLAGRVTILHFAGYSDVGVSLSDDKAVYVEHISTWSRPPDLIFLNSCHNAAQATRFARELYASLLADSRQVALQSAFTRADSKVLLSEVWQARSRGIDTLKQDDAQSWNWSLLLHDPQVLDWTLYRLLTHKRPRFEANGELLNPHRALEAFRLFERNQV